ncbi:hypothetical protein IC229_20910 [Spirosoma sp. BT702]|uniref:Uncharacterized protein n=1 Tax=Spirosoma profusum TaxID=2771354 RepID=A0A927AS09_9BACT|nr:hypothetical protein [Spirosoma profusum]MBD2703121.1 hypothetical protein [Spirosoma profusum]
MTIELYSVPVTDTSNVSDSPISNTTGELPEQEPEISPDNLLGSFDTREEALAFVENDTSANNQTITDSQTNSFDAYTHVELLTVTIRNEDQSTATKQYYLVNDEGY